MVVRVKKTFIKNRARKIKKRAVALLILIMSFLLMTSFFAFAVAYDNSNEELVQLWISNQDEIQRDYLMGTLSTDIAGIIKVDEKNIIPFYSSIEHIKEGASIFGNVLPGQAGRTIILGHNEQEFVCLSKAEIGDKIVVESYEGNFIYTVQSIKIEVPSEIPLDDTDESVLTLVSRYPFRSISADRRYVVEAILS